MNDLAKTLAKIQEEMKPWQAHNFPDRGGHCPLLGIVEELGELEMDRDLLRDFKKNAITG